jgi:molecular chaperone DnaK
MIHSVRKSLKEYGDKLSDDEKSKIEAALKDAEEALKSDSKEVIESKTQVLAEASHKLAEKMYSQEQPQPGQPGTQGGPQGGPQGGGEKPVEGEVVDAEFEEVKNKKE